jgi:hypothetical protein
MSGNTGMTSETGESRKIVTYEDLFGDGSELLKYRKEQTYEKDLIQWADHKDADRVSRKMKKLGISMDFVPPEYKPQINRTSKYLKKPKKSVNYSQNSKHRIDSSKLVSKKTSSRNSRRNSVVASRRGSILGSRSTSRTGSRRGSFVGFKYAKKRRTNKMEIEQAKRENRQRILDEINHQIMDKALELEEQA